MDSQIKSFFDMLQSVDKNEQYAASNQLMELTSHKVNWAYDVWG
ncbi:hypothetical protein [Niallia nealsonii]